MAYETARVLDWRLKTIIQVRIDTAPSILGAQDRQLYLLQSQSSIIIHWEKFKGVFSISSILSLLLDYIWGPINMRG